MCGKGIWHGEKASGESVEVTAFKDEWSEEAKGDRKGGTRMGTGGGEGVKVRDVTD
jgi:hypothetical protein